MSVYGADVFPIAVITLDLSKVWEVSAAAIKCMPEDKLQSAVEEQVEAAINHDAISEESDKILVCATSKEYNEFGYFIIKTG